MSGSRSNGGKSKSNSKKAIGNFFGSKNKEHLFLNEDDVDTYISYPPKQLEEFKEPIAKT